MRRWSEDLKRLRRVDMDQRKAWQYFRTPLDVIEKRLGVDISGMARALAEKRDGKSQVKILDLGCGRGTALAQLKQLLGASVKTVGVVEERTPKEGYSGVDRLLVGNMLQLQPRETYDVIFSHMGAVHHTPLQTTAVERVIGWLKPEGTAALEVRHAFAEGSLVVQEVLTVLAQNGIKDWKYKGNVLVFKKPAPRVP
ncbi:MAG: class I SAM-dependent methyltransferase [Candidatus Diapherotrites archaeon]|nr:class I SAM-dependent methyltransferase [Candidatus Diapherotrites archaeon]